MSIRVTKDPGILFKDFSEGPMDKNGSKRQQKDIDVLAVGGIDIDWLLKMPKLPSFDEKLRAEYLGQYPGGPVGNFACIASSMGLKVASMCTLGDDEGGNLLLQDFKSYGVDVSYITVDPEIVTPFVIVIVDPTGEKAVIIPDLDQKADLAISPEAIKRSKYVYMMGFDYERFCEIGDIAHPSGTKMMADIEPSEELSGERIYDLLSQCDIASFNEQGFKTALKQPFSIEAAKSLLDHGPEIVIVTRGGKGVVAVSQDQVVHVPAYDVPVRDTTGAGDTFNAAFLYATVQNLDLEARVQFGNAAAAILIQTLGTRTKIPKPDTIKTFILHNNHKISGE